MKKILYIVLAATFLTGMASCTSDDSYEQDSNAADVTGAVTAGTWKITTFIQNGTDQTTNYAGYDFTFSATNILTAINGTSNYNGIWSVANAENSNPDFDIEFSAPDTFVELSEHWIVLENTDSKIRLKHSDDNGTDFVTFKKSE